MRVDEPSGTTSAHAVNPDRRLTTGLLAAAVVLGVVSLGQIPTGIVASVDDVVIASHQSGFGWLRVILVLVGCLAEGIAAVRCWRGSSHVWSLAAVGAFLQLCALTYLGPVVVGAAYLVHRLSARPGT